MSYQLAMCARAMHCAPRASQTRDEGERLYVYIRAALRGANVIGERLLYALVFVHFIREARGEPEFIASSDRGCVIFRCALYIYFCK